MICEEIEELQLSSGLSPVPGIKPFLKWAGGKTQLIPQLEKLIPTNFKKYIEPFIGGGALFFHLNPRKAIISDSNEELICTYESVRDHLDQVITVLNSYHNTEEDFYRIRGLKTPSLSKIERAARFIYLNKTCYNGLYRVNKNGNFNVPYGKRKGNFYDVNVLERASSFLKQTTIIHSDYLDALGKFAEKGDFVFLDPPYHPISEYADFKRYTKESFYLEDQVKMRDEFIRLVEIGCHVVLTNSDSPFVLDLYKDFEIRVIETKRLISSKSSSRTGRDIIVIGK